MLLYPFTGNSLFHHAEPGIAGSTEHMRPGSKSICIRKNKGAVFDERPL